MDDLDIGEVARQTHVNPSALRFYERKALIRSNGRNGLRRQYPASVVERVALIALGQAAGFSLDEMARMFATHNGHPAIDRDALAAKAAELDVRIRHMTAMRDGLRHAAVCPAPSHTECPKFRRLVRVAASGKMSAAMTAKKPANRTKKSKGTKTAKGK
ncbi:DNA-binding transcriptional MerR regulator [Panacagrimonas perspica]|uniref:DNA-binding transcriptional MerR regulator n=1 Tax=Panacagrimonas perspica TaxID=381431 RepID=A0A4R7P641_9GAMM|nr:helix-turn-helix domain-containing protein [Panacagrimonas perspica]TDU28500.1 DNA-binding transcriptional MerR regulator [Panacagrimonas perspica]THD00898.1 MerR family transcriptional regulator [Panacagrimonas perspica]